MRIAREALLGPRYGRCLQKFQINPIGPLTFEAPLRFVSINSHRHGGGELPLVVTSRGAAEHTSHKSAPARSILAASSR
jgi:hypothetical protein